MNTGNLRTNSNSNMSKEVDQQPSKYDKDTLPPKIGI